MNMGIHPDALLRDIIVPTLRDFEPYDLENAAALLLGIASVETDCGRYLRQHGGGPARGLYQMEPATIRFVVDWAERKKKYSFMNCDYGIYKEEEEDVPGPFFLGNLVQQTVFARAYLLTRPERLPDAKNVPALAAYWKKHWNTSLGRGKEADFIRKYPMECNSF